MLVHGRYRLHERLGAGGFGVVWRAEDELLHREVALKLISLRAGGDPIERERATREAHAAARLSHPSIVALYEAYLDEDTFYLISELVHGETLAQLIATRALSDEEILEIGIALAHALAHAHARGVVHRDVKPQNVLVPNAPDRDTPAKLTDFGGASLAGEDALTRTGETLGTLAYMAPEQSEGFDAGEPADLYSLALVLYEAFAGTNPVRGLTPAATARRIGRPIPPLQTVRPDLPRPLTLTLDTALALEPAHRGTLDQLCASLESALAQGLSRRRAFLRPRALADDRLPRASTATAASPSLQHLDHADPSPRHFNVALPRAVWLGCALAAIAWQLSLSRPGVALLLLAATFPLLLRPHRIGIGCLAGALAPVLGLAGLAGAFPAIAGQASRWRSRAILGILGYWWLTLSEPLFAGTSPGGRLWLGPPSSTPPRAVWEGSLTSTATHVLAPALTLGLLLGAALWAAAAILLPWIVRGRHAILDTLAAVIWAAVLLLATPYLDSGLSADAALVHPRGVILGAILAAALAIAARALRGPV